MKHLIESTEEVIDTKLKNNRFLNIVEWLLFSIFINISIREKVRALICTKKYIEAITPFQYDKKVFFIAYR